MERHALTAIRAVVHGVFLVAAFHDPSFSTVRVVSLVMSTAGW